MVERAAAPIRRKLCQVNADHGELARSEWSESCRVCLEGMKGMSGVVGEGERVASREAQVAVQKLVREVTQALATFSS